MGPLDGRVALVTGAGRGLGREYAGFFARDGAKVVVSDVNEADARAVAADVESAGGEARGLRADVTRPDEVQHMVEASIAEFGKVDILVNNAGIWGDFQGIFEGILDTDLDYWNFVMAVNLTGAFLCSKAVAPSMVEQGWGRIINISSQASRVASGVYGVSKLAVSQLTFATANQLGVSGITVNALAPGTILNEATAGQIPQAMIDEVISRSAVKRGGTGADLYSAIAWLCRKDAGWVSGQTIHVNGGALAPM